VWRQAGDALVIFQGPSFYVSPSLYEDKPLHGKVVPTWNYAVVHAHGPLTAIEDPAWLLALLARLTDAHETRRETPWSVQDAPPDFIDKLLGAIVGIEIPVQRLEGKWKMSQNRSALDQRTIAAEQRGQ
jgi:transcriptional regulator